LTSLVNIGRSQTKTIILCERSNEPIPFASISWNDGKSGVIANNKGEIIVPVTSQTVLVSAVGFKDSLNYPEEIDAGWKTIYLSLDDFTLPLVEVRSSKGTKKKIDVKSKKKTGLSSTSSFKLSIGTSIPIEKSSEIRSVQFYVDQVGVNHPFLIRLRIVKQDDSMYPTQDIMKELVEVKPTRKGWINLDLTDLHLHIDSGYYVFALEWLLLDEAAINLTHQNKKDLSSYLTIRTYINEPTNDRSIWHKNDDRPWMEMNFVNSPISFAPRMRIYVVEYD